MLYSSFFVALLVLASGALIDPSPTHGIASIPGVTWGALVLGLALGPWYFRLFAFLPTYLVGHDLVVHGLLKTWRIPIEQVAEVRTSSHSSWVVVRLTLAAPIPGLGKTFRVLSPSGQSDDFVAGVIETMQGTQRVGA